MPPINAVVLGAGSRGTVYGAFAVQYPQELQIVAVAEPRADRREQFAIIHDLPPDRCFESWQDLIGAGKIADVLINCTQDRMHAESTLAALDAGYDVLLEKPMSPVLHENVRLVQAAEDRGRLLQICHVLRYSPYFQKIREIVQSGRLGRIISVDHRENLIYWHMAHSFVRGNWRNLAESAPMILAKCCHDLDILVLDFAPAGRAAEFVRLADVVQAGERARQARRCAAPTAVRPRRPANTTRRAST